MPNETLAPALQRFVKSVVTLIESGVEESELHPKVGEAMNMLVKEDDWLDPSVAVPHPHYYQQYLLYADPEDRFSVVSFVWGPGQKTPIHDHTVWGVELVKRVGSERFKLLYDIYHMQIMEGDVIRTIRDNHQYIAHYHTGGVPGRAEIDETQELYYPAIMRAIVETGFKGFVAQEFVPKKPDALASLKEGVLICDV